MTLVRADGTGRFWSQSIAFNVTQLPARSVLQLVVVRGGGYGSVQSYCKFCSMGQFLCQHQQEGEEGTKSKSVNLAKKERARMVWNLDSTKSRNTTNYKSSATRMVNFENGRNIRRERWLGQEKSTWQNLWALHEEADQVESDSSDCRYHKRASTKTGKGSKWVYQVGDCRWARFLMLVYLRLFHFNHLLLWSERGWWRSLVTTSDYFWQNFSRKRIVMRRLSWI